MRTWAITAALLAMAGAAAHAQQAPARRAADLQTALWAASCMACHGTDGKAEGTGLALAGRSAEELYGALVAYRLGQRKGTIMHHHAKGYSEDELRRIADYFALVRP